MESVDLSNRLRKRREQGLFRDRLQLNSAQQTIVADKNNSEYLSFCSNDYLGLANHPKVIAALKAGADRWGAGAGASHLVTGHMTPHQALEEELAAFVGAPKALLFSTGYMANLALASVFAERGHLVLQDKLNHASLLDAGLLSRATMRRYPHVDMTALERQLSDNSSMPKLIMSDAVFSMDGDLAPVPDLVELTKKYGALLVLDDAHGFGVLGADGQGSLQHHGVAPMRSVLVMATLGKAAGTFGAFVAGDQDLIETLIQFARTYIYTTAPPPALAEATRAALGLLQTESWRRDSLRERIKQFRLGASELGLPMMLSDTHIQPLVLGSSDVAVQVASGLRERGILISAIRPPTVPVGSARLRITLCAEHTAENIERLLDALDETAPQDIRQSGAK